MGLDESNSYLHLVPNVTLPAKSEPDLIPSTQQLAALERPI
jgi:hypothetical protein